jgi:hypothetical protein
MEARFAKPYEKAQEILKFWDWEILKLGAKNQNSLT